MHCHLSPSPASLHPESECRRSRAGWRLPTVLPRRSESTRRRNIRGAGRNTATAGCRWSSTRSRAEFQPAREQLGFGHEIAAHARTLPHRVGRKRDDVQAAVDEAIGERAGNLRRSSPPRWSAPHRDPSLRRTRRCRCGRNRAETARARPARSASAASRTSTGGSSMPRPALAHHLSARFGPIDEGAASAAAQHRGLCAE